VDETRMQTYGRDGDHRRSSAAVLRIGRSSFPMDGDAYEEDPSEERFVPFPFPFKVKPSVSHSAVRRDARRRSCRHRAQTLKSDHPFYGTWQAGCGEIRVYLPRPCV
jgi:hypothetical protein